MLNTTVSHSAVEHLGLPRTASSTGFNDPQTQLSVARVCLLVMTTAGGRGGPSLVVQQVGGGGTAAADCRLGTRSHRDCS